MKGFKALIRYRINGTNKQVDIAYFLVVPEKNYSNCWLGHPCGPPQHDKLLAFQLEHDLDEETYKKEFRDLDGNFWEDWDNIKPKSREALEKFKAKIIFPPFEMSSPEEIDIPDDADLEQWHYEQFDEMRDPKAGGTGEPKNGS